MSKFWKKLEAKHDINNITYAIEQAFKARGKEYDDNHTVDWDYDEKMIFTEAEDGYGFEYSTEPVINGEVTIEDFVKEVMSDLDNYEAQKEAVPDIEEDFEEDEEYDEDDYDYDYDED